MSNNSRDCEHGRLARSCTECLLISEIQELQAENTKLREGLAYYADTENMKEVSMGFSCQWSVNSEDFEELGQTDSGKTIYFYGKLARQILREIEKND